MPVVCITKEKKCTGCGAILVVGDNYSKANAKSKHNVCSTCIKPQKRSAAIKYLYGITQDQYNTMFDDQEGCCKCCGRHQTEFKRRLAVDHVHDTGVIRGLLCMHCNTGIGKLGDDLEGVMRAVRYLQDA